MHFQFVVVYSLDSSESFKGNTNSNLLARSAMTSFLGIREYAMVSIVPWTVLEIMIDKFKNFAILQFERYLNAFWICSSVHKCGGVRLAIV